MRNRVFAGFEHIPLIMQILSLVRHSHVNIPPGICYGRLDVNLSEPFENEARKIQNWLMDADIVYSSTSSRCSRLGRYLADFFSCSMNKDERLQEMNFGDWEGKKWDDIARFDLDDWGRDVLNYQPPGGESANEMLVRVRECLQEIVNMPFRHGVVVAHGGSLRAILSELGKISLQETMAWQIDFGAVIQVKIQVDK